MLNFFFFYFKFSLKKAKIHSCNLEYPLNFSFTALLPPYFVHEFAEIFNNFWLWPAIILKKYYFIYKSRCMFNEVFVQFLFLFV